VVGAGTDLSVSLAVDGTWLVPGSGPRGGAATLPAETFSIPLDPARAHGVLRATRPVGWRGHIIDGLELRLAEGAVTDAIADGDRGGPDALGTSFERAATVRRVALQPHAGRLDPRDLVWHDGVLAANDGHHIAVRLDDRGDRVVVPIDSAELCITGIKTDGREEPIVVAGEWAFDA
jgi:leucyl aminopeptidase (aminopeptidase T)